VFATVALLAYVFSGIVFRSENTVSRRLKNSEPAEEKRARKAASHEMVVPVMNRISQAAARPFMPKTAVKQSSLRRDLAHAGIYSSSAMELIVGLKVILLVTGAVGGYILGAMIGGIFTWLFLYIGALLGFMLPGLWL